MRLASPAFAIALMGIELLAGCGKAPVAVLELKISAGDWTDYQQSLQAIADRQTTGERKEFEQALQDLKFQAMHGENPALRGEVRAQLAGLSVRDVLVLSGTMGLTGRRNRRPPCSVRSR